jgi:hypothetical protein
MGFIVALPCMAVLYVLNKRIKGKQKGKQPKAIVSIFTLLVAFAVGCGLAYSFAGRWFADLVSFGGRFISSISHTHLTNAIALALTLLAILWASADVLYDRKADKGAQIAVVLLPTLLALVVGGQLGASGGNAVQTSFDQLFSLVGQMGGGA